MRWTWGPTPLKGARAYFDRRCYSSENEHQKMDMLESALVGMREYGACQITINQITNKKPGAVQG